MKKVTFSENIFMHSTYSSDEYLRTSIDHVIYRKSNNIISKEDVKNMYIALDLYKLYDMTVHIDSLINNQYHTKKFT